MRIAIETISTVVRSVIADRRVVVGADCVTRSHLRARSAHLALAHAAAANPPYAGYPTYGPVQERQPGQARQGGTSLQGLSLSRRLKSGWDLAKRFGGSWLSCLVPASAMQPSMAMAVVTGGSMPAAFLRAERCSIS